MRNERITVKGHKALTRAVKESWSWLCWEKQLQRKLLSTKNIMLAKGAYVLNAFWCCHRHYWRIIYWWWALFVIPWKSHTCFLSSCACCFLYIYVFSSMKTERANIWNNIAAFCQTQMKSMKSSFKAYNMVFQTNIFRVRIMLSYLKGISPPLWWRVLDTCYVCCCLAWY